MGPENQDWLYEFSKLCSWSSVVPLIMGLAVWKTLDAPYRVLFFLAIVSLVMDKYNFSLHFSLATIQYFPRVFTVLEFTLISVFFVLQMRRRLTRRIIIGINVAFLLVAAADLSFQSSKVIDNFSMGIEAILFLIYSVVSLYFVMKDMVHPKILATAQFWSIAAILLYFGGNIFLFISMNYLASSMETLLFLYVVIHGGLQIAYNLLLTLSFWKAKTQYL